MCTRPHFSIFLPAHNEERYLGDTLEHIAGLEYPADSVEVLAVENDSSDRTLEVAGKFESNHERVF